MTGAPLRCRHLLPPQAQPVGAAEPLHNFRENFLAPGEAGGWLLEGGAEVATGSCQGYCAQCTRRAEKCPEVVAVVLAFWDPLAWSSVPSSRKPLRLDLLP